MSAATDLREACADWIEDEILGQPTFLGYAKLLPSLVAFVSSREQEARRQDALVLEAVETFYAACNGFDPIEGGPTKMWSNEAEDAADALFAARDARLRDIAKAASGSTEDKP